MKTVYLLIILTQHYAHDIAYYENVELCTAAKEAVAAELKKAWPWKHALLCVPTQVEDDQAELRFSSELFHF